MLGATILRCPSHLQLRIIFVVASFAFCAGIAERLLKVFGFFIGELPYFTNHQFDFLAAGAVLSFLSPAWVQKVHAGRMIIPCALLGTPLLLLALSQESITGAALDPNYRDGAAFLVTCLCFTGLVSYASGNGLPFKQSKAYKILNAVGERYTIYLIHPACMAMAWPILASISPHLVPKTSVYAIGELIIMVITLIPLTELVYHYVELPCIKWGKEIIAKNKFAR